MPRFEGRVVVITGGAQGIGLATASAFAAEGAVVVLWDKNPGLLEAARARLRTEGTDADARELDVSDAPSVQAAAEAALERHGQVDVLINNAGVNFSDQSTVALTDAAWETLLAVNLKGTMNTVRALSPAMVRRQWGRIVNTSSILARFPVPTFAAYSAAKAGVIALTEAWARELGPQGVTVNAVAPGFIDTPMNATLSADLVKGIVLRTPVRRLGTTEDVARVHLFLAAPEAAFINGALIPVDGGLTL